jgi:hypothetical protein
MHGQKKHYVPLHLYMTHDVGDAIPEHTSYAESSAGNVTAIL